MHRLGLCEQKIKLGLLMCLPHWRMVPRELQQRINALWAEVRRDLTGPAFPGYSAAVREAEQAVKAELEAKA
jgi:hypothetical protein